MRKLCCNNLDHIGWDSHKSFYVHARKRTYSRPFKSVCSHTIHPELNTVSPTNPLLGTFPIFLDLRRDKPPLALLVQLLESR
jgi:hypothetical protein